MAGVLFLFIITQNLIIDKKSAEKKVAYEFNKEEALEMFRSAHAISVVSLQNANLTLKHAARYFLRMAGGSVYTWNNYFYL